MPRDEERIHFLINSRSGAGRGAIFLDALRRSGGINLEAEELDRSNLKQQVDRAKSANIVVVAGGDGTLSTVVPLFEGSDVKVGVLPLGTGNDLSWELGIFGKVNANDPIKLTQFYRSASSRAVGLFHLRYGQDLSLTRTFLNYVSLGFDARVVAEFSRLRETKLWRTLGGVWGNRLGYGICSLQSLAHPLISIGSIHAE
jgi:diacylglycerol kinase family enzyme